MLPPTVCVSRHYVSLQFARVSPRYPSTGTGGRFDAVKLRIYDAGLAPLARIGMTAPAFLSSSLGPLSGTCSVAESRFHAPGGSWRRTGRKWRPRLSPPRVLGPFFEALLLIGYWGFEWPSLRLKRRRACISNRRRPFLRPRLNHSLPKKTPPGRVGGVHTRLLSRAIWGAIRDCLS